MKKDSRIDVSLALANKVKYDTKAGGKRKTKRRTAKVKKEQAWGKGSVDPSHVRKTRPQSQT